MIALVQLPEIMEKDKYERIVTKYPKFMCDKDARIAEESFGGSTEYRLLKDDEYFMDEVHQVDKEYMLNDGTIVPSYNLYVRPEKQLVALVKPFAMVDIEAFATVAEGVTFTVVEVYRG